MPVSEVFNLDCMAGMSKYPDKYFDLAVVDPPYGIGEDGHKGIKRGSEGYRKAYRSFIGGDKQAPDRAYFEELKRVSKNQIIFGSNHFIENISGANSSCWIVWDKQNGATDFADCELAYTSFKTAVRIFRFRWNGFMQGDMKNWENRIHPTQKPVALYSWIFEKYAKPGDKILDTHLGSASSRIAAHRAGLDFVGFELDEYYFNAGNTRFEEETAQMCMNELV